MTTEQVLYLCVDGKRIATLTEAEQTDNMFWWEYTVTPITPEHEGSLRDHLLWEKVGFTIADENNQQPNPNTFSGGYDSFCDGHTNRLSFRSLPPTTETPVKHPRLLLLIAKVSVVAFAFHLCGDTPSFMMPLYRMLLFASLVTLLPLFGWVVPTTIAGILMSLATPDVATMTILIAVAFVVGCILDEIANVQAVRDGQSI